MAVLANSMSFFPPSPAKVINSGNVAILGGEMKAAPGSKFFGFAANWDWASRQTRIDGEAK